jgi:hypothetical protein
MEEHATPSGQSPMTPSAVTWPVWLLLGGAIAHLAVAIAPDSYSVFGPYLLVDAGMVLGWVQAMSPFLLAAAVVLSANRWPSGRRMMLLGAAALAVVAALRLVIDIWWALWEASDHLGDPSPPWLQPAFLLAGAVFVGAQLLLARGLWVSRGTPAVGGIRAVVLWGIALAGVVATGFGLWVTVQTLAGAESDYRIYVGAISALTAVSFGALAALAFAAARMAQRGTGLPETLIALGAGVTLVAAAWGSSYPYVIDPQELTEPAYVWAYTLPWAGELLGSIMMVVGFGLGALAVRRRHLATHPAP